MEEIWKDVIGYEGFYQVSNLGRVKSVDRYVNRGGQILRLKSVIVKISTNKVDGYNYVGLYMNGKGKTKRVHKLVAEAFIPNPGNKMYLDHIDMNKNNNRVDNIRWCTKSENQSNIKSIQNTTSKYKGVHWAKDRNKWRTEINLNGKRTRIGSFDSEELAAKEYDKFAKKYFGDFARLNFQ